MNKIILTISFVCIQVLLIGQGGNDGANFGGGSAWSSQSLGTRLFVDGLDGKFTSDKLYSDTKGSPYLTDEPVNGILVLNESNRISDVPFQIDLFTKEIIITDRQGNEHFLNKEFCHGFIIPVDGKELHFSKLNSKQPDQFYELLFDNGVMKFFKERYVTRKDAVKNGVNNTPAKFKNRVKYFIDYGDGETIEVKLNEKNILSGFSRHDKVKLKKYIKTSGLNLKDESDFIQLFNDFSS